MTQAERAFMAVCRRAEGSCADRGWGCWAGHDNLCFQSPEHHRAAEGDAFSPLDMQYIAGTYCGWSLASAAIEPCSTTLYSCLRQLFLAAVLSSYNLRYATCALSQVCAAVFVFRGTVLTKRSNFAADLDVWRNANRDLYFAARAVKHLRLEMAQLQRQYPGVQWGFFCTGALCPACNAMLSTG